MSYAGGLPSHNGRVEMLYRWPYDGYTAVGIQLLSLTHKLWVTHFLRGSFYPNFSMKGIDSGLSVHPCEFLDSRG